MMIYPSPKYEEYQDGMYSMKTFDGNLDLMHIFKQYKDGNSEIEFTSDTTYGEEQYDITVNENGVKIIHFGECGIFRALTSVRQLLKQHNGKLPFCKIKDCPDFSKRGFMLDISRGKVPKVSAITRWIDILAELKYNEFQLYIENFVVKYKAYPQCTEDFDCLTTEDIEYLDNYCRERFIELVPNQNGLGHMQVWLEREEFKHLKIGANGDYKSATLNPLLPESFELMSNIYESLLPHFTSDKVNIGLDEAFELGRYELEEVCKEQGKDKVFMDWLCKLSDHIGEKYNKKVQFWADMIYKYPDAFKRMPKDATALVWGYDVIASTHLATRCKTIAEKGCDFYVCPGDATWNSITGRFDVMELNVRIAAEVGKKYGAKGYLFTGWGNTGHPHFYVWSYVPVALAALYAWNSGKESDWLIKSANVKMAQKYTDNEIFGAPISKILYRLQRYYLLEPECIHDGTIASNSIYKSIDENLVNGHFNLYESGDNFYFDNVIEYVGKILKDVEKIGIDSELKAQIECNAKTVIFAEELNKLRLNKKVDNRKLDELILLADYITKTFDRLWEEENYSHGKEIFLDAIDARRSEIVKIKENL